MIRRPPRSTLSSSSAASDVYKRQVSTQSTGHPLCAIMGALYSLVTRDSQLALEAVITPSGTSLEASDPSPRIGYCFSGGGTRAYTCTMGYLRALHHSNSLRPEDLLSCVSGGSWACNVYAFALADENTLLGGLPLGPRDLTLSALSTMPETSMGHAATSNVLASIVELAATEELSEVWIDTIGKVFLEPYGIALEAGFTTDEQTAAEITRRNPGLGQLIWPRPGRPQPVTNATLIGPAAEAPFKSHDLLPLEICPQMTGVAGTHVVTYHGASTAPEHTIGGYVETFAFGSNFSTRDGAASSVAVSSASPFSVKQATGISSAAFAVVAESVAWGTKLAPSVAYWAPDDISAEAGFENTTETTQMLCGDGGSVENYGLIPMLRRQLDRIVVFVSTSTPLSLEFDPSSAIVSLDQMDMFLPGVC
eukprot:TRINITY_DN4475_c0_g1_i11.p1 TRINITY_DN4475_c0_g1~~TRINITY_DN4475_c0_g1_i11.p1  ORF type:complete len:422 (+),score=67.98 TRINITY_DN4475_c0_g1_i11:106-1371(+)